MSFFVFLNRIYGGCKNCRKYSCLSKIFYNVYDLHIQKKGHFIIEVITSSPAVKFYFKSRIPVNLVHQT